MLTLVKNYFKSKEYAQLTLREAIAIENNIKPAWIESHHSDFDKKLIDIMKEKVKQWETQGVDTTDMDISVIALEFKKYEQQYRVNEPKEVTELKSRLAMVANFYKLLEPCPDDYVLKQSLTSNFDYVMEAIQKQIDDAS